MISFSQTIALENAVKYCSDAWRRSKNRLEIFEIKKYIIVHLGKWDWVYIYHFFIGFVLYEIKIRKTILPEKISQFKFFRFEISLVTFPAITLRNATFVRPLFTIKNNMLNDFILVALPTYWHRHLKSCLGLNFQFISFPIARVLASWS